MIKRICKGRKLSALLMILLCTLFVLTLFVVGIDLLKQKYTNSEGSVRLNIPTYIDGKDQATHPSVIDIGAYVNDEKWNGYRYWMAYTPYPFAEGGEENPSVAASNDLMRWETPEGLCNPIANNEETCCDELKDTHILFRDDLERLEVWYLGRVNGTLKKGDPLLLFYKYSYDGINWSDYIVSREITGYTSPSLIWQDGIYRMWAISTDGALCYAESADGSVWSEEITCRIGGSTAAREMWHGSVAYQNGQYDYVFIKSGNANSEILYAESRNGIDFDEPREIIRKGSGWDRYYRPCLIYTDEKYYCFYGVITESNEWYISLSKGNDVDTLEGIREDSIPLMTSLDTTVESSHTINSELRIINQCLKRYCRFEVIFILLAWIVLIILKPSIAEYFDLIWLLSWMLVSAYLWLRFGAANVIAAIILLITSGVVGLLFSLCCLGFNCVRRPAQ